jgi:hypothetical protein
MVEAERTCAEPVLSVAEVVEASNLHFRKTVTRPIFTTYFDLLTTFFCATSGCGMSVIKFIKKLHKTQIFVPLFGILVEMGATKKF